MKTTFDQLTILFTILSASALKTTITGGIYKLNRPDGSLKEDVVINSLPVSGDQIQRGTANVNIYVPDLKVSLGSVKQPVPDTARMGLLAGQATTLLAEHYSPDYAFWLVNQSVIAEPETSQHYVNLRIDFQFFPTF